MLIEIKRRKGLSMTFSLNLSGLQEVLNRLIAEQMTERLAAMFADGYDPEASQAEQDALRAEAQENMRRFIRSIKTVIGAILITLRALALNRLRGSRRQSPSDLFVDGLVASIPVPPTTILSCAA